MAYLKLNNGKGLKIDHSKAKAILDVLEGRTEPEDDKQEAFILKVHKIYFSWLDATDDDIQQNADIIIPCVLARWAVDSDGVPTRPDSHHSWAYAKQHQLWLNRGPSPAVRFHIDKIRQERQNKAYKRGVMGNKE